MLVVAVLLWFAVLAFAFVALLLSTEQFERDRQERGQDSQDQFSEEHD